MSWANESRQFACGCRYEATWDAPDHLSSYWHESCSECFDALFETLDRLVLDKGQQLTLELPSQCERPEAEARIP